jgi:hypothetical protein
MSVDEHLQALRLHVLAAVLRRHHRIYASHELLDASLHDGAGLRGAVQLILRHNHTQETLRVRAQGSPTETTQADHLRRGLTAHLHSLWHRLWH